MCHVVERLEPRRLLSVVPTVVDLLVVYTPAAKGALGGDAQIQSVIQQVVNTTNGALLRSLVPLTIRLVHSEQIAYTGSGDLFVDRTRLREPADGFLDSVHALRDTWGADLVSLITDNAPNGGGNADLLENLNDQQNPTRAFSAMDFTSLQPSNLTMAHELGHNLGGGHERGNPTQPARGPFTYSYGFRFTGTDGVVYHDIMSYDPGLVVPYYANPSVTFAGSPTGSPIGAPDEADLYSTFIATAPVVAAYRPTVVADTSGPGGALYEVSPPATSANLITFTVRWRDDSAVNFATLDSRDVFVRTPEGFELTPEYLGADGAGDAFQALARYRVTLPDSNPLLSSLTFHARAGEVRDRANNAASTGQLAAPADDTAAWDLQAARRLGALSGERVALDSIDHVDSDDVYQFTLASTSVVSLHLDGLSDDANVFVLHDLNGNGTYEAATEFIFGTFGPGSASRGTARTLGPGTYYAWVYAQQFGQVQTPYTLTLRAFTDNVAPTATLDATDVKQSGAPHVDFAVTYRDDQEIDAETARYWAAVDIDVVLDGGGSFSFFYFPDPDLNPQFPQNAREFTTIYRILPFNQTTGWTAADNGLYTVRIHPNTGTDPRVHDAAGNDIPLLTLGSFRIAIGTPDAAAPTAIAAPAPIVVPGQSTYDFTVAYRDNVSVNGSTIDGNDVRVTGPGGYDQLATLVSVSPTPTVGSTRLTTYRIPAPGGTWGVEDDGAYSIVVQAGQVLDSSGNAVPPGPIATINVHVPLPGDANGDDRVNLADFNILAANFGQTGRGVHTGDFNFDGVVNLSDFNLLASRFGQSLTPRIAGSPPRQAPAMTADKDDLEGLWRGR
jgi:hypothetical protein